MIEAKRNAAWSRDELLIALDLYLTHRDRLPDRDDPIVENTSRFLRSLSSALNIPENYRNASAVYMKLANFRSIDPMYTAQGKRGLSRGGKGDVAVWNEFADRRDELRRTVDTIRQITACGGPGISNDFPGIEEAPEGRLLTRFHVSRERNPKLVAEKKKRAIARDGQLRCEVCDFDFSDRYGERGYGFIEVHHVKPLHSVEPGTKTRLDDLALLCANCHRMIHAQRPWLSLSDLKMMIRDGR